ncbi:MAG TPA: hypothetical protein VJI68_02375 [Candidatus Nanoarchaeia archaeon]|nr:hypothetical protein [Candidatus Nanoarchaeia archaeon]
MTKLKIEIWHGAHNKFILVPCEKNIPFISLNSIKKLNKKYNTDGLVQFFVENNKKIFMKFFDPAGNLDNCGNALRVVASYCVNNLLTSNEGIIISLGSEYPFSVSKDKSSVIFPRVVKEKGIFLVGGVSHKIVFTNNFESSRTIARLIRKKLNCNVTIVKKSKIGVFAQTFEIGVENFTASCGTGAIAASVSTNCNRIFMPGGVLEVNKLSNGFSLSGLVKKYEGDEF